MFDDNQILYDVPYAEAIRSLMYVMVCSRPNLAYSISILSRFMMRLRQEHQNAIKGVLRYVKGALDYGLEYDRFTDHVCIVGYTNSDFVKDCEFGRSIYAYIFIVCGNCVSWKSRLQFDIVLSTTVAGFKKKALDSGVT